MVLSATEKVILRTGSPATGGGSVIVYMPKKKLRGTVYVERLNVSGTVDASPDSQSHTEVARQRAAVVLVSAQQVGVDWLKNGGIVPGDPVRYASRNQHRERAGTRTIPVVVLDPMD